MSKLFVLGTGFSKAVSSALPVMFDLGDYIRGKINELSGDKEIYERLISPPNDLEDLLTYLCQSMPWKNPAESYSDKAAFLQLSNFIAEHIIDCEEKAFQEEPPEWSIQFIKYLDGLLFSTDGGVQIASDNGQLAGDLQQEFKRHGITITQNATSVEKENAGWRIEDKHRGLEFTVDRNANRFDIFKKRASPVTVATFNFDTAFERLYRMYLEHELGFSDETQVQQWSIADLYPIPLAPLEARIVPKLIEPGPLSFALLKLHGSVNWYFLGDENVAAQQVYYTEVAPGPPTKDHGYAWIGRYGLEIGKKDLVPLIIPPAAEKAPFYGTQLVKVVWRELRSAIKLADEIYFVGYSLPKTDLTTRLFFSSAVGTHSGKRVYIVDKATGPCQERLRGNYSDVFGECNLSQEYLGKDNAVELMVRDLVK